MLTFRATGDWGPGQVSLGWAERSSRREVPEVERIIEETWARVSGRPGVHLFDGPMCRLESFDASGDVLDLSLSHTSYKAFVGTNLEHPHLADPFGPGVMANPLGVSALLETADGYLMLGRRNASVAYYPNRVHPFAGALEPRDGADPFAAVYRELAEELSLSRDAVTGLRCRGLVEDSALRQPELVFHATSSRRRAEVEDLLDRVEHHGTWAVQVGRIDRAIGDPALTPVAVASLLLWGRARLGTEWFDARARHACRARP